MRVAIAVLLILTAPVATAQSPSRDWRPEDRTVIGDFSRITSIAASMERVYIASPTSLVIRHPQFQRWAGPFEPPRRDALVGVFAALVDPLDQSLWFARPDGWLHYQPELQLWDRGRVPDGVVTIAFDEADPVSGLFVRTRRGWYFLQRGGDGADARQAARPSRSPRHRGGGSPRQSRRCRPTPRRSSWTRSAPHRCASPPPRGRSTTRAGTSAPSGHRTALPPGRRRHPRAHALRSCRPISWAR